MASRPAKRQRRGTVVLSDDDDEPQSADLPLRTPRKQQTQLDLGQNGSSLSLSPNQVREQSKRAAARKKSSTASPATTPKKSKKAAPKSEPEKNQRLSTFFSKVTDEQRWRKKSDTPEDESVGAEWKDAIVDDDLSDTALLDVDQEQENTTRRVLDRRKGNIERETSMPRSNGALASSQRFAKPSLPSKATSVDAHRPAREQQPLEEEQHRPWADRYGPLSLDEIAVHKKKVQDVQKWLDDVLSGRARQRLLVLKGPAGSGKTTTVSLLAQTLGYQLIAWQNPVAYELATAGSVAAQFDDFLNRGGQFGSLSFGGLATTPKDAQDSTRAVLLVEEFPSTGSRPSDSFHSVLLRYLTQGQSSFGQRPELVPPLIMIISETLLNSSTAFSDSFTAHRLLGSEILNHPLANVIEFNPIATTFVSKALELVVKKEARDSGRRRMPGPAVMQQLAEMSDVRSAVNTLEFLCVRNTESDWSGTVAAKPRKGKGGTEMTDMERNSLQLVCQRETTLDMFHAAGKIVYNKREDPKIVDPKAEPPPKPPSHLMHLYSPKVSQVDIEALLNETGTDIQTFVSTLHENYGLSCNGESFIDSFEDCSDILSVSDILNPDSRRRIGARAGGAAALQSNLSAGSTDALRQDEISFNVATRGLLFHLPYPVNRAAPASGRKADSFKMFYPVSLRLWKPTEEVDSLISHFAHSEDFTSSGDRVEGVASWKNQSFGLQHHDPASDSDQEFPRPRKIAATKDELATEILPYLTRIRQARKQDTKALNRITQMQGLGIPALMGEEEDEQEPKEETIVAAEKVNAASRLMADTTNGVRSSGPGKKSSVEDVNVEHLFLEDDDIVDD